MQHLGRNILSMVISRILSSVILFLIFVELTNYLGTDAAGQYGLLASYLTIFNIFVDLGMSQLVIKKMSENKQDIGKYFSNYMTVQGALSLVFMLIMAGFVYFADYPTVLKNALYVTSVGLFLTSISLPLRCVVIANQRLTINAKINFINSMINAAMMLLAIKLGFGIFFLAFISLAISIFDFVVYGYIVNSRYSKFNFEFDKVFIKQLFVATWPFTLLTIFSIYNRIDGLILPHFRSFVENGYYATAYKFWDFLAFIPAVVGITLFPFFAQSLSANLMDRVKKGLETYSRFMIALGVPLAVGTFLLSKEIILTLFEPEFAPASTALWLLVAAVSFLIIYTPINSLIISKLTRTATKITGINLLMNVTLNLILIPKYGFVAAAAVTLLSEIFQTVCYAYFVNKRIVKFNFIGFFVKPVLAALIMAGAIHFVRDMHLVVAIGIGGLVYAAALLLLRFFHKEDWELLKAAANVRKELNPEQPGL